MAEQVTVQGRKFFSFLAGKTNGAHQEILTMLKCSHQVEVESIEDCDYVLLFCPVASRVATDINEALNKVPAGKPVILVVMHHTFDHERIVSESRRQVHNTYVILTVDVLFHESQLLRCNRNDISKHEIQQALGVPVSLTDQGIIAYAREHPYKTCGIIAFVGLVIVVIVVSVVELYHKP